MPMHQELAMPDTQEIETKAVTAVDTARGMQVKTAPSYREATVWLRDVLSGLIDSVKSTFGPVKEAAHEAHKVACAAEKKHLAPLEEASKIVKGKLLDYEREQEAKRQEEERRKQTEADARAAEERRKLQEQLKAEAEARAKAERAQAEAEAKLRAAEATTKAAEATTKAAKAEAARMARENEERKDADLARIANEAREAKARAEAEASARVQAEVITVASKTPEVEGSSTREQWGAEVVSVPQFVRWLATQPDNMIELLVAPNMTPLNQQAKSLRAALNMPGVRAVCKQVKSIKGVK